MMTLCLMGQYFSLQNLLLSGKGNEKAGSAVAWHQLFSGCEGWDILPTLNVTDSGNKATALKWFTKFLFLFSQKLYAQQNINQHSGCATFPGHGTKNIYEED